jgi:DivIVA domain-containing protein
VFWFMVIALVVVVSVVALVVLGAGGSLPAADADRAPSYLPNDRPLNRADLDGVRFAVGLRGYRMDEVDALLERLGAESDLKEARLHAAERALTVHQERALARPVPSWAHQDGAPPAPLAPTRWDAPRTEQVPPKPDRAPELPSEPEPVPESVWEAGTEVAPEPGLKPSPTTPATATDIPTAPTAP